MSERLIRGKAIKGDRVYGSYSFQEQLPITVLIERIDELFAKGALAIAWRQDHGVWDDSSYSDFSMGDMMITKDPEIVAQWIENHFGEYEDDEFFPGDGHPDGMSYEDFPDVITSEFDHASIEHFGKNARIVITPEDVYRFEYEGYY